MKSRVAFLGGLALLLVVVLILVFSGGGKKHHHATCWAKPGHWTASGIVVYGSSDKRRHGAGSAPGICDPK